MRRGAAIVPVIGVLILASVATAVAQRRGGFGGGYGGRNRREAIKPNPPNDGRFTFVRVRHGQDYNTDISEYWQWSDTGLKPIDESNEAYKIGVNYIIYGTTH